MPRKEVVTLYAKQCATLAKRNGDYVVRLRSSNKIMQWKDILLECWDYQLKIYERAAILEFDGKSIMSIGLSQATDEKSVLSFKIEVQAHPWYNIEANPIRTKAAI